MVGKRVVRRRPWDPLQPPFPISPRSARIVEADHLVVHELDREDRRRIVTSDRATEVCVHVRRKMFRSGVLLVRHRIEVEPVDDVRHPLGLLGGENVAALGVHERNAHAHGSLVTVHHVNV